MTAEQEALTVTALADPWTIDHHLYQRIQLALSILGHASPTDEPTRLAIGRALAALRGATLEQLTEEATA